MVEAQFESIMSFKESVAKHVALEKLFDILDNNHDGRIDGLELLGGIALVCQATFEEKARFCFELYDFNLNAKMSQREMTMMMMASICGVNMLTGGSPELEPQVSDYEKLSEDAFRRVDREDSGQISYDQFVQWARSNRDLMAGLESLGKLVDAAKGDFDGEDSAEEVEEGNLSDAEMPVEEHGLVDNTDDNHKKMNRKTKNSDTSTVELIVKNLGGVLNTEALPPSQIEVVQWKGQLNEPTSYIRRRQENDGPDTNLELSWAFGYRAQRCRSNLFYVGSESNPDTKKVVYTSAALGIVYDMVSREQTFYQGHKHELSCIALHPSGQIVATGDVKSNIHLWNATTMTCVAIIKGMVQSGVQHLKFSPSGDRIATVGLDPDHTVTIYDCASGEIISSAKGLVSPNNVFDMAYSSKGTELILVGRKLIRFFRGVDTDKRALNSAPAKIGKEGKRQTYFCAVYCGEDAIVGCAGGELYRFRAGVCIQVVQAHGVREPVLCISYNAKEGVLVTGGKDCLIKTWDSTLKEIGASLDMSEDLDGGGEGSENRSLDSAVISVQMLKNRILVGTRGSDIFESRMPANPSENHTLTRIAYGHSGGEITCLAAHPSRDEFATCGTDRTLRIWSIRSHEQINMRKNLPVSATAVAYNYLGDILAIGMEDGSAALIEANNTSLRVYSTWKHSSSRVNDIKFSPDGQLLAVASSDSNIYLYRTENKKTYRRHAVCRGHTEGVTHFDFSLNSQYIQSNGEDKAIIFWDIKGNRINTPSSVRDVNWSSFTCIYGWPVQGIWPTKSSYDDINSCMCSQEVGDIITGGDDGMVKLYRYPAVRAGALHQTYVGHASPVVSVGFSSNRRFAISAGGEDRTILLWKHEIEQVDSSGDELPGGGNSSDSSASSASSGKNGSRDAEPRKEIADVGERSTLQEAVNQNRPTEEIIQLVKLEASRGDQSKLSAVAPWKSSIVEPTEWTPTVGSTDIDFELQWIHGFRSHDCRNNVRYSAAGSIVYTAAAVGVVYSKSAGKQRFLQGAHKDEIVGITAHPSGQIFATGEAGRKPTIIIWDSQEMRTLNRIEGVHERGIPLLAFNSRGNILASIGLDTDHSLSLYDWGKGIELMKTRTDSGKVLCMCFLASDLNAPTNPTGATDVIVTGGERHLKFWWSLGQNVKSQRGMWGHEGKSDRAVRNDTIMCVASGSPGVCVTGSVRGLLLVWQNFKLVSNVKSMWGHLAWLPDHADTGDGKGGEPGSYPHKSAIQAIWSIKGEISIFDGEHHISEGLETSCRYITGDKQGVIAIWRLVKTWGDELRLKCVKVFNIAKVIPKPASMSVRSLCERDGAILIGTQGSEIFEVLEDEIPFLDPLPSKTLGSGFGATIQRSPSAEPGAVSVASVSSAQRTPSMPVVHGNRLVSGHSQGELWGLTTHPMLPVFFTAGDDRTLRCWSTTQHRILSFTMLDEKCRTIDILPSSGEEIALGLNSGTVLILKVKKFINPHDRPMTQIDMDLTGDEVTFPKSSEAKDPLDVIRVIPKGATRFVQIIKYCFEGSYLAVGSHDCSIYLYDVKNDYAPHCVCLGHKDYITHIDFGVIVTKNENMNESYDDVNHEMVWKVTDSNGVVKEESRPITVKDICMQTTCNGGDIMYWHVCATATDSTISSATHAVSSPTTPAVTSLVVSKSTSLTDLQSDVWRACSRISSASVLKDAWWATWTSPYGWPVQGIWAPGDDGTVVNAVARSHSWTKVPTIATVDDFGRVKLFNYPCTVPGAPDKCYKGHASHVTNIAFSHDDAYCLTIGGNDKCIFVWGTDVADEIRERAAQLAGISENVGAGGHAITSLAGSSKSLDSDLCNPSKILQLQGGDESMAIKPWKGAIREPSDWKDPQDLGSLPSESLELKFVYGYRGWDCRNNIGFADSNLSIVYHVAGVGVVYDSEKHVQIHNTEHDDDIICLAMHPEGHTVATGEIGAKPKIVLWDANTGVTVLVIQYHKRGISNLGFSGSGSLLVSIGMDDDRIVAIHNTKTGAIVGTGKSGRGIEVFTMAFMGDAMFITGGKNHIKFWDLPHPTSPACELPSKGGIYHKNVTSRTVASSTCLGSDALTGMSDGTICLWKNRTNTKFTQAHNGPVTCMCSLPETSSGSLGGGSGETGPRAISGGKDGFVYIWNIQLVKVWTLNLNEQTPASICPHIQAIATKEGRLIMGTKGGEIYDVNMLNTTDNHRLVQGHSVDRAELWALAVHPTKQHFVTACDDMSVRVWDARAMQQIHESYLGVKIRAAAYSPDGSQIAFGTFDGRVRVLSHDLMVKIADVAVAAEWSQAIGFSPDGHTLAVGSHDNTIYLLDTKSFSCRAKLKGHHSYITAFDFSVDSKYIQSVSGDYELLFWDSTTGKQMKSATEMRDIKWFTTNCTLGWAVQGIWPPEADGTDVNSVSASGSLLVSGDDYRRVKLFKFPCPKARSKCKEYKGHTENVVTVRFSADGKYVYSVGGLDKAIIQWQLKKNSE